MSYQWVNFCNSKKYICKVLKLAKSVNSKLNNKQTS